jgi:predicted  nucleic acid-binding Zn-ribbon protein
MDSSNDDRTASLMTPAKLAQVSAAARKPISPTAFLDQMAADAGHQHITRLSELQADLQEQAGASRGPDIQPVLERLAQALPSLDFSLLQSQGGLWASLTGKNKNAGAGFAAQVEEIDALVKALPAELASVGRKQQPHAAASDRSLVELEVEYRALDKIIDQGARWLQDMRNQIKTREAQAGADAEGQAQIRADSARCETLVARLKLLRACVAAAQQVHQQVSAVADRRTTLQAGLQKSMGGEAREWRSRLGTLAGAAAEGKVSGLNLDGPKEAHKALRRRLDKLLAECEQLRTQEEALAHSLTSLGEQLSAAT